MSSVASRAGGMGTLRHRPLRNSALGIGEQLAQLGRERDDPDLVADSFIREFETFRDLPVHHNQLDPSELVGMLGYKFRWPGSFRRGIGQADRVGFNDIDHQTTVFRADNQEIRVHGSLFAVHLVGNAQRPVYDGG
jgi:hypothetical protein